MISTFLLPSCMRESPHLPKPKTETVLIWSQDKAVEVLAHKAVKLEFEESLTVVSVDDIEGLAGTELPVYEVEKMIEEFNIHVMKFTSHSAELLLLDNERYEVHVLGEIDETAEHLARKILYWAHKNRTF
jgi:hypothetical protein